MPFDGVDTSYGYIAKLDQVIDLIETPNHWVKHSYSTPWGGYCLREALNIVGVAELFEPVILKTAEAVMAREFCCIESFNDHPLTRHGDVLAVLQRARADLLGGRIDVSPSLASWLATASSARADGWLARFWGKIFG